MDGITDFTALQKKILQMNSHLNSPVFNASNWFSQIQIPRTAFEYFSEFSKVNKLSELSTLAALPKFDTLANISKFHREIVQSNLNSELLKTYSQLGRTAEISSNLSALNNLKSYYAENIKIPNSFFEAFNKQAKLAEHLAVMPVWNNTSQWEGLISVFNTSFAHYATEIAEEENWEAADQLKIWLDGLNSVLARQYETYEGFYNAIEKVLKSFFTVKTAKNTFIFFAVVLLKDVILTKELGKLIYPETPKSNTQITLQKVENNVVIETAKSDTFSIKTATRLFATKNTFLRKSPNGKLKKGFKILDGQELIVLQKKRKWVLVAFSPAPLEFETGWVLLEECN